MHMESNILLRRIDGYKLYIMHINVNMAMNIIQ